MNPRMELSVRLVKAREGLKTGADFTVDDGLGFLPDHLAIWARTVAGATGVRPIDVVIEAVRSGWMWHRGLNVRCETSGRELRGPSPRPVSPDATIPGQA